MIVCHCNRITSRDIDDAVCCLKTNCPNKDLCPNDVYEELGVCAKCCNCFPQAEKLIHESAMRFVAKSEFEVASTLPIASAK